MKSIDDMKLQEDEIKFLPKKFDFVHKNGESTIGEYSAVERKNSYKITKLEVDPNRWYMVMRKTDFHSKLLSGEFVLSVMCRASILMAKKREVLNGSK